MICIDPMTAKKSAEPFSTLAKLRKKESKITFGLHVSGLLNTSQIILKSGDALSILELDPQTITNAESFS